MRILRRPTLLALVTTLAVVPAAARAQSPSPSAPTPDPGAAKPAPTPAAPGYRADTPKAKALYHDGPTGRFLLGGQWLFRFDRKDVGLTQGFMRTASTAGWTTTAVPNAWNATDPSPESFTGTVGWYRKDFKLPSAQRQLAWIVRFESVNYRSRIWLNGKPLGSNRGAYLPFELRLPPSLLKRSGTNRLVVRVDNRRRPTDFPPSNLNPKGMPTGGWWNYGGLLREVYLRKVDRVDLNTVVVRPELPCATCDASVLFNVTARNASGSAQKVALAGHFGARRFSLGTKVIGAGQVARFTRRVGVANPQLWSPASPRLYPAGVDARAGKDVVQRYVLRSGIRSIKVVDGRLMLNGRPLNLRGVGYHEDSPTMGSALDDATRAAQLRQVKELGATILRSHYPLHPFTQERADQIGLLLWSEIPVYSVKTKYLKQKLVRDLATKELRDNILINGNHAANVIWSIGNELSARPGPVQGYYIQRAVRIAHELDPTRPVGLAVAGYPAAGCQPEYAPLDVVGVNMYFGWYPGPNGQIADRSLAGDFLDSVHACYPKKALMVTEFGAEANRDGPVEEKGTYQFQTDWTDYMLNLFASKPYLNGAIYWAIQEFRVRPGWDGGNPRPSVPSYLHQKGLIAFDGKPKPVFADVQRIFKQTVQVGKRR